MTTGRHANPSSSTQHVLVHIDHGLGPIGAWSYAHGHLSHFYPDSLDTAISGRARILMAQRPDDTTITEWMDFIAEADANLLDDYETFDCEDELPLSHILGEFRRSFLSSD